MDPIKAKRIEIIPTFKISQNLHWRDHISVKLDVLLVTNNHNKVGYLL